MVTRPEIVEVLDDLVEWGNALTARTNDLFKADALEPPAKLVCYLGAGVHRSVRAIHILEPHHLDDQIDPLARNIAEAALDVEYISVTTKRGGLELTPRAKTTLFNTSFLHNRDRLTNLTFMKKIRIKYSLQEQAVFDAMELERAAIKIRTTGHFWHGTTQGNITLELMEALKDNQAAVDMIRSMSEAYIYLSQQTHTGPNYADTFAAMKFGERPTISGTSNFDASLVFALSIAAVVLARWGLNTENEDHADAIFDKRDALQKRLLK